MAHTSLYFLALFCLSTSSSWTKLSAMPVDVIGFWRLGIACVIVLSFLLLRREKINWPGFQKDSPMWWFIISGFFFFLHLMTYKYAAKNTTIAHTMIIFATNPVWSSLGAYVFFSENITKRVVTSYVLALMGLLVLFYPQLDLASGFNNGDLSAVISAALYAAYMLTGKKARQKSDNLTYAFFVYGICGSLFLLSTFFTGHSLIGYSDVSWLSVAGLILLPTLLGHMSFTYLVNHMNITVMTCGKLIEPVFASIIAYYLFSEKLDWTSWIAFIFTIVSVFILFEKDLRRALKSL